MGKDSPISADVMEIIAKAQQAQEQQAQAQAPYSEQLQALELQKIQAQILELQAKAQKYSQQGALVEAHTTSEELSQVQAMQAEETKPPSWTHPALKGMNPSSKKTSPRRALMPMSFSTFLQNPPLHKRGHSIKSSSI